ncbi:DoxX family protein [Gordonia phthalatica]|uniref:DoxX family protein n=1 Tax=Gordonia phthalatica TaxID=1136941 RepID=A0A0N9NEN2_9ACTN|nr:DoxX family protein [Gordonia phthalatica]
MRRPKPDNDDFYDKHRRRPAPAVQDAIDAKAERERAAEPDVADAPTEALPVVGDATDDAGGGVTAPEAYAPPQAYSAAEPQTEPDEPAGDDTGAADDDGVADDGKTAVIISSGVGAAAQNPVKKSVSTEPVHTEPFTDDDDDDTGSGSGRRYAEQMTEPPLPYIEPQPTAPFDLDEDHFDGDHADDAEPETVAASDAGVAPVARRGTLDLGLLLLRVAIGATFTVHGLQKLTGWFNGPGPNGFADFLTNAPNPSIGFNSDITTILAFVAGVSETAGGILLVLGLLTPIAGAAVLSSILVALTYRVTLAGGLWFFAADGGGNGIELEAVLAAAAAALILTGPGTYSVDRRWGWSRRPAWGSGAWLLIGIGVAVATWMVFNGTNPLASPGNPAG